MANIKHHREGNIVQFRGRGVRAQLREHRDRPDARSDLKWTGGKAGS